MEIINVATAKLSPYPHNAKLHPDKQIDGIAESIRRFGFIQPVVIDKNSEIIIGHGRIEAAKKIGIETVPCVRADALSPKEIRALRLIDNRIAETGWNEKNLQFDLHDLDFDFEPFNIDFDEFNMGDETSGLTDQDAVPEAPKEPITKPGDLWQLGEHRLLCGDSTKQEDVERLMNGDKADLVFTDPPYGVSYADKNKFLNMVASGKRIQDEIKNDHMDLKDTEEFIYKAFCQIKKILAERSSYYITAPQGGDLMMMMMMQKAGIPLRHCLIWVKNNHVLGRTDYNYKHEPILFGWDKVHDFYGKGEHKFSTWEIDKPLKNDLHPTMKPVALIENAILNSSKKDQIVADLFGGSGSALIACEKTGRKCRMLEIDTHYCDVIISRWHKFTGKEAKLLNN